MSFERRKVIISFSEDGTPLFRELKAYSHDEMDVKIVKAFIESGRIWDIDPSLSQKYPMKPSNGVLLKDYAKEWLDRKKKIKQTTLVNYRKYLTEYVIPALGNMELSEIKVSDIQCMLDRHENLAHKTLVGIKTTLSQVLKYAVSDELINKNPCESVDIVIPSDKVNERRALPLNQFQDIMNHLNCLTGYDKVFLALCLFTAMRRGEALGLRWEDIYDEKIHIQRNVTHPQQNQPVITTPKTKAGIRSLPLTDPLKVYLEPFQSKGFVLGGETPLSLSSYRAMWKRISQTIDMHGATPHVLRHSYLTYAVGTTNDYKTIQGIFGHADIFTLLNRYAHPQEEKVKELSDTLALVLTQKVEK